MPNITQNFDGGIKVCGSSNECIIFSYSFILWELRCRGLEGGCLFGVLGWFICCCLVFIIGSNT